jgi:hypothetical protein
MNGTVPNDKFGGAAILGLVLVTEPKPPSPLWPCSPKRRATCLPGSSRVTRSILGHA